MDEFVCFFAQRLRKKPGGGHPDGEEREEPAYVTELKIVLDIVRLRACNDVP